MAGPYAPSAAENYVGIGKQSARGTAVAPTAFAAYLPTVDLDHGINVNLLKEAGAAGAVTFAEKAEQAPQGKFIFLARPSIAAKVFAYLLGTDGISGAGDPYTHALTPDFVTDYITVEQNLADAGIERFADCVIYEVEVTADRDNPALRVSASWKGGAPAWQASATSETYETARPFLLSDGTFTIDGGAATDVTKFTFVARMLVSGEKIADVVPAYQVKVGTEVEIEVEQLAIADLGAYRKVPYGTTGGSAHLKTATAGSFIADFNYTDGQARELKLEVPTLDYSQSQYTPLSPEGSEGVKVTTSMAARKGASALLTVTAKNADTPAYV